MWRPEIAIPPIGGSAKYQGLGWMIMHEPGAAPRMYGHDGGALGQTSFFRLLPDHGIAVVLLTNGGDSLGLYAELVDPVLRELAGVEPPMPLTSPIEPLPIPVELVQGRFESLLTTTEIRVDENGEVWVEDKPRTEEMRARTTVQPPRKAVALDATRLITSEPHEVLAFLEPGVDGRARYLYRGGRLRPRRD
jgi:CubicO group peptidase (beta-lactamase class C family)